MKHRGNPTFAVTAFCATIEAMSKMGLTVEKAVGDKRPAVGADLSRRTRGGTHTSPKVPRPRIVAVAERRDAAESRWLDLNRAAYANRWIALDGDQLLAVADTAKEVFGQVTNHRPAPLVIRVTVDELPFAGW
jgi:hypothetical protein